MPKLLSLPSTVPGAILTGAVILLGAAATGELAYRAGLADVPSAFRRFYWTPSTNANRNWLEGSASDRLEEIRIKAHWSRPDLVQRLEAFQQAGADFWNLLHEVVGEPVSFKRYENRAKTRRMLDTRDAFFRDMSQLRGSAPVSERQPESDRTTLSSAERKLLSDARLIATIFDALGTKKDGDDQLRDKLKAATNAFLWEEKDIFINPAISTATLNAAVEETLAMPVEKDAVVFRRAVQEIAEASTRAELEAMGEKHLSSLLATGPDCSNGKYYKCTRNLGSIGKGSHRGPDKGRQFHRQIFDARRDTNKTSALLADAFLDPEISTSDIREAASRFYNNRLTDLQKADR